MMILGRTAREYKTESGTEYVVEVSIFRIQVMDNSEWMTDVSGYGATWDLFIRAYNEPVVMDSGRSKTFAEAVSEVEAVVKKFSKEMFQLIS